MPDRIEDINNEIRSLKSRMEDLVKERQQLREEKAGIVPGTTVVRAVERRGIRAPETYEYLVTRVEVYGGSSPALWGRKRKKNGDWGKAEQYVYGDWEKVDRA